jgi:hypothetical protein
VKSPPYDPPGFEPGRADQALREQFEGFAPRVLTWLGALPTWTAELGRRLGLSGGGETITKLMNRLDAEDLIETREILDADGRTTESFWLRPSLRQGLGRYLQQPPRAKLLDRDLDALADAVRALEVTSATTGSIGSAQWLRIVGSYRGDPTGLTLMTDVDELVADGRLGDASTLVAAARGLGELASRTLSEAARRAQWRVDRAARIEHDVQRLRHYCPRPPIETAIRELIESAEEAPGGPWALHLLGDGGVGKTMLIRYLATGRFAAAQRMPRPFLVARADFDHLDPSYPEQRPAELLLALAADLVGVASTRELYRLLRLFQDAASALHEELAGYRSGTDDTDSLRRTVRHFADFVNGLGAPVLLVLDTCEELEKLYLPRAPAPAIDQTFRLLEFVHQEAPTLRVLFAGRRWLVPTAERSGAAGPLLRPRPYLRVVPVGGFTEPEAEGYIDERENRRPGQPAGSAVAAAGSDSPRLASRPGLRQALLDRSRSATRPDGGTEYSPFELASYCDWAASDPDLDADRLRSAPGDPYVEWRIIGRLGDDQVRGALGVAAEFGRFDLALVTPALTRAGVDARAAFDGLAAQEWVNVASVGDDGAPAVIEIDEHLLDRIRKVTARGTEWAPLDRRRLGEDARQVIEGGPLASLPVETVEAAVRLLSPEQAAALWQRIEDWCCEQRAWGWAARVTERVAALEARRAEAAGTPTILAAIFATQAAATLHIAPESDPAELWRNAESLASRHPVPALGAKLLLRARLGRLATGDLTDTRILREALDRIEDNDPDDDWPVAMRSLADPSLAGGFIAALYACTARADVVIDSELLSAIHYVEELPSRTWLLSAKAAASLARAAHSLWTGSPVAAAHAADQAIEIAHGRQADSVDWADWAPPRRLEDQCRLVRMIIAWRGGEVLDAVPWREWRDDALNRMDDPDTERLAAATIRFELGHRPIGSEELERVERLRHDVPARRPLPWTHRQIGPLVVELAEAWRVDADPHRGCSLLNERIDAAVAAGDDPDMIEECQLAQLRICRRERTTEYVPVKRLSREGAPHVKGEAWLVRTLVDGEQPRSPEEAGGWSAWWRCQDTASLASLGTTVPAPPPEWASAAEIADVVEFGNLIRARDDAVFSATKWQPKVLDPEGQFRVLEYTESETEPPVTLAEPTLPPGDLGRGAMAAAEVTALRFPERGIDRLRYAARQLVMAGDETGAMRVMLLASLTMARRQDLAAAQATWATVEAPHEVSGGWQARLAALEAYLSRRPAPAGLPPSPEIKPAAAQAHPSRRGTVALSHYLLARWAVLVVLLLAGASAGLALVLALVLTRTYNDVDTYASIAGAVAGLAALAAAARVLSQALPYRFARARAIKVSQPGEGEVAAGAVPSRGVRDLRGLGLATIWGALAARWPLWTMFRPWRGPWDQNRPIDPEPAFDLDGLRLPARGGLRRLVLLEIRTDTAAEVPLPWEEWLGGAMSAERAAALLCYRRTDGLAWTPSAREWRAARSGQYGTQLPDITLYAPNSSPASFQLLYIVGTPVPTSAGWRLRVAVPVGASETASRGAEAGEELLSVTNFPLSRMGLAVLQAEPVDGPPRTLAGLRSGFMGCARDIMEGGANAVMIVPPLPDGVAREVQAYLSARAPGRRRPLSPTDVLRLLAHVKQLVARTSPAGSTSQFPVLDVMLFLRGASVGALVPTTERSS